MNQEWENPFSIGTNENNETVIRLGGQLASKKTFGYRDWETDRKSVV